MMLEPEAEKWRVDYLHNELEEPNIVEVANISQAISLKRIADALERLVPANPLLRPDGKPNSIMDIARQGE